MRTHYFLALLSLPGVGRKTALGVMKSFNSATVDAAAFEDFIRLRHGEHRRLQAIPLSDASRALDVARRQIDAAEKFGLSIAAHGAQHYPPQLMAVADPPAVLFLRGAGWSELGSPSIAVLGTRKPTGMAAHVGRELTTRITRSAFAVVSGLAVGCDTIAHEACLDAGGVTIAVLGHGLDTVYPRGNAQLAERIVAEHGALVSEYPLGVRVSNQTLVERDRIQSALSRGLLVLETGLKGGTYHAVRHARQEAKPIAAYLPPERLADEPALQGNLELIRTATAEPIRNIGDMDAFLARLAGSRLGSESAVQGRESYTVDEADAQIFAVRDRVAAESSEAERSATSSTAPLPRGRQTAKRKGRATRSGGESGIDASEQQDLDLGGPRADNGTK